MRPANDPVPLVMNEINCGKSLNLEMPSQSYGGNTHPSQLYFIYDYYLLLNSFL